MLTFIKTKSKQPENAESPMNVETSKHKISNEQGETAFPKDVSKTSRVRNVLDV